MKYLYPLKEMKFFALHRKAWQNGWTYGPGFDELYSDYLNNWNYFKYYLDRLITNINLGKNSNLKILIGEAPPFWAGNSKSEDRTYFYNPKHTYPKQTWLTVPYNYFVEKKSSYTDIINEIDKKQRLTKLAENGVLLIDVFPFPIWQDTKVRNAISDGFSIHIRDYFIPHIQDVLDYIQTNTNGAKLDIKLGFMAPEYTSLQLMYGKNTSVLIQNSIMPRGLEPLGTPEKISNTSFNTGFQKGILNKASKKAKFLFRIINDENWGKGKPITVHYNFLEEIPIFISEGGSPNFYYYCNSKVDSLIRMLRQN